MKRLNLTTVTAIIMTLLVTACLEGCRSHKESAVTATSQWIALSIPVKIRIAEPQKASLSGTAIFERGRAVNLSFRMLGMEVAQARLTADSAMVIDKFHKKYICVDPADFMRRAALDMTTLQNLLLGIDDTASSATVRGSSDAITIEQTDPTATPYGTMAAKTTWRSEIKGKSISGTIEWDFGRARWNDDATARPITIPEGYSEVDLTKLLTL